MINFYELSFNFNIQVNKFEGDKEVIRRSKSRTDRQYSDKQKLKIEQREPTKTVNDPRCSKQGTQFLLY